MKYKNTNCNEFDIQTTTELKLIHEYLYCKDEYGIEFAQGFLMALGLEYTKFHEISTPRISEDRFDALWNFLVEGDSMI